MGLAPINEIELKEINGGGWANFLKDYIISHILDWTIEAAWEAFKRQVEYDKTHPNTTYNWNGSATWR